MSMSGPARLFFLPFIMASHSFAQPLNQTDLFDLSLEQLSSISVTGAAVRSLSLGLQPTSNNTHASLNQLIPSTIEVVDRKTIEARGLKNVVEVVESMVGILSGESPSEPYSFSTRGFTRNSINVVYDGISMGLSTLNMRPQNTFNIDHVEVSKGASSLLYAEGAAGGTVNIISKKPVLEQANLIDILTSYGRYNTSSINLGLSGSQNATSAYRLDINHNGSDGWVDRSRSETLNTTASYLWKVKNNLQLLFSINYLQDSLPAYWGTPLVPSSAAQMANTSVVSASNNWVIDESSRFTNYNVSDNVIESSSLWSRLDMTWQQSKLASWDFTLYQFNADRLWQNAESYNFNETTNDIRRDRLSVDHKREIQGGKIAYRLDLSSSQKEHSLAVHVENSQNTFRRFTGFDVAADFYDIDAVNLMNPIAGNFGVVDIRSDHDQNNRNALIFEHRLQVAQPLYLDWGIRFEQINLDRTYTNFDGSNRSRKTLNKTFTQNSYRLGANYILNARHVVYAHVAQQHDPLEADLNYFYDISLFKPSDVTQWEAGLKSHLDNGLTELSFSFFDIKKEVAYQAGLGQALGKNKQTSQGFELAVEHEFSKQLRLGSNLAYTDAQYGHFYDPDTGNIVTGNTPVNVPETMLSIWLSYQNVFNLPLEVGGGYNGVSKRYADSNNDSTLNAYELLNVFAAYERSQYRVSFSIRNLTDEIYATWSDIFYPNQVALGSPRTYELSFRAQF